MWFDTLDQLNESPVKFTNELTQKLYVNGGIIKSSKGEDGQDGVDGAFPATDKHVTTQFATLTGNFDITESSKIFFENPTASLRTIELDGKGYVLRMPLSSSKYFILDPNVHLILKNVVLRAFNPEGIDWGKNSRITFGDGTILELPCSVTFDRPYQVKGNVCIDGRGARIYLEHDDALVLDPMAKLVIRNATVMGAAGGIYGRLRALEASAMPTVITLQDTGLLLEADYTFSAGSLNIVSDAKIYGRDKKFTFASTGIIFIESGSTLTIDHTITFSYQPTVPTWGHDNYNYSKERIVFEDESSTLHLNGCVLHSTHTGIRIKNGRVLIQDHVKMVSVAGIDEGPYGHGASITGEEIEIFDSAQIKLLSGSVLEFDGRIRYRI